jgi:hypothetical protein
MEPANSKMIHALLFLPALLAAGDQPCDKKLTAAINRPHATVNVCLSTDRLIPGRPVLLVEFEFDDIEEHGGLIAVYDLQSLRSGKKKALFEDTSSEGIVPFLFAGKRTLTALADFDGRGRVGFAFACLGDTDSSLRIKAWDPVKASFEPIGAGFDVQGDLGTVEIRDGLILIGQCRGALPIIRTYKLSAGRYIFDHDSPDPRGTAGDNCEPYRDPQLK